MKRQRRLVIAGGSGFIGQSMAKYFSGRYDRVIILSRRARPQCGNIHYAEWDGVHPGPWMKEIDGAEVLINLTGRSVDCRYTARNKAEILRSRLDSTLILGAAVIMAEHPPHTWINAGTATYYRHAEDRAQDEFTGENGDDFSMGVARQWEQTFFSIPAPGTRKIVLRMALVLGQDGGVYPVLRNMAKLGLGGHAGSGRQMVSWIHMTDLLRATDHLIEETEIEGPVNLCAPEPVTNRHFMRTLRRSLGMPIGIPQGKAMLEVGAFFLRTETELLLKSRWVVPARLAGTGFAFSHPTIENAFHALYHEAPLPHPDASPVVSPLPAAPVQKTLPRTPVELTVVE